MSLWHRELLHCIIKAWFISASKWFTEKSEFKCYVFLLSVSRSLPKSLIYCFWLYMYLCENDSKHWIRVMHHLLNRALCIVTTIAYLQSARVLKNYKSLVCFQELIWHDNVLRLLNKKYVLFWKLHWFYISGHAPSLGQLHSNFLFFSQTQYIFYNSRMTAMKI